MLRTFCDHCNNPCSSNTSGSRKFDAIGFDLSPTRKGVIGPDIHICDECLPNKLIEAAQTFESSKAIDSLLKNSPSVKNLEAQRAGVEQRGKDLTKQETLAAEKLAEAEKLLAAAQKKIDDSDEQVNLLKAQVRTLNAKLGTAMRIETAQKEQLEIDKEENPAFTARVWKRERLRAS